MPQPQPAARPPAQPAVEYTPTGEPIMYGPIADMPWCYMDNDAISGGGCVDTQDQCSKEREQTIRKDFAHRVPGLEKHGLTFEQAKAAAASTVTKRWSVCMQQASAVCFAVTARVSGFRARACYTRLGECQREFQEMRRDADWSVDSPSCIIMRAR
jgi:hypothetical protein